MEDAPLVQGGPACPLCVEADGTAHTSKPIGRRISVSPRWSLGVNLTQSLDARLRETSVGPESGYSRAVALLAQLVEHLHGKEGASGSSPEEGLKGLQISNFCCLI
jgi:hypothetical protein